MIRIGWLRLLSIFILCGVACAEIPLTLVQTIQLPAETEETSLRKWDVQHWMNDSTWGWAALVDSHLFYMREFPGPLESMLVPAVLFQAFGHNPSYSHRGIRLFRYPDLDSTLGIALLTDVQWYHYYDYCGEYLPRSRMDLSLFSTADGSRTSYWSWEGSYMTAGDVAVTRDVQLNQINCVPAPPLRTSDVFVSLTINEVVGEHTPERYTTQHFGELRIYNFAGNTEIIFNNPPCEFAEPFIRSGPVMAVGCGHAYSYVVGPHGDSYVYWDYAALNHFVFPNSGIVWDSLNFVRSIAQSDSNGMGRIIGVLWDGAIALSETGFDTLWQNPGIAGTVFTARLVGNPNERILSFNSSARRFRIFDAADGGYLETMIGLAGDFQYIIKRTGFESEFVTFESSNRTIGIYKSTLAVHDLTCRYLPEVNRIRLRWSPIQGATSYRIYTSLSVTDNPYQNLGEVPSDCLFYELIPEPQMRFFYVTAEVGER